jgi:integrase
MKHARAWAERIERDLEASRAYGNTAARTMTLSELIRLYIHNNPKQDKSGISNLNWWKREYGEMKLAEIDRTVVRAALNRLKEEDATHGNGEGKRKSRGHKRSHSTVNRYKSALSTIFEYGREHYDLPDNPCRQVKSFPEGKGRVRFLSDAERKALLNVCRESEWPRLYLMVLMAITTGARQGELLRLRWRDIRFKEKRAYVVRTKNGEPRVLPLVSSVIEELKALPRPLDSGELIFPSGREPGKPFEFRKHWVEARDTAKLQNFRFHDLRHTCASYLAQNGATLLEIADVLGHKQLEVTKRYAHLCVDHKQKLVDRLLGGIV